MTETGDPEIGSMVELEPAERVAVDAFRDQLKKTRDDIRRGVFRDVDLAEVARRFERLEAMRWERPPARIQFRSYARGVGAWGTAWVCSGRIVLRIPTAASLASVLEVLLHELVHLSCPVRESHGELFRRRLIACAAEAFGIDLDVRALLAMPPERDSVFRTLRAYAVDRVIAQKMEDDHVGERFRADPALAAEPEPVETLDDRALRVVAANEARKAARKAHAAAKLAEWERRAEAAKRLAAKWRAKVRGYERREAAAAKTRGGS